MAIFSRTYENLIKDGYTELDSFETVISFMRQLEEDNKLYKLSKANDWWSGNKQVWLIEIIGEYYEMSNV